VKRICSDLRYDRRGYGRSFDIQMPPWGHDRGSPLWLVEEMSHPAYNLFPRRRLDVVTSRSPVTERRSVEAIAVYFKREFGYDFVQFSSGSGRFRESEDVRAFVWSDIGKHRMGIEDRWVTGATCFRWREYLDAPSGYAMQWIWLHPYVRHQGLLTSAWPFFRARFGDFVCEPPLSDAMSRFLEKLS